LGRLGWQQQNGRQMSLQALKVRGPFLGPTGYDHHVREFVRGLDRAGVAVQLVDLPEWGPAKLPRLLRDPWFESLTRAVDARLLLHFCMPHQVAADPALVNVNYTMFEATRIPNAWVARARRHDLIVLPTESSRRAWIDSGVPAEKLRLCPLGVDADLFRPGVPPLPLTDAGGEPLSRYRVRFLNMSELGPRENVLGLLRLWLRATTARDDAVLILKLGAYLPGWPERFQRELARLEHEEKPLREAAPVHVVQEIYPDADMPRLYAAATHYISLSFGEGWDQPMVEAGASGLKLIAPEHSAYTTYLDRTVADLIPSREVPAVFPGGGDIGRLFDGACWWEPDPDAAIAAIRRAIDGRDGATCSVRSRLVERFSWEQATRRLIEILSEPDLGRRRSRLWRGRQRYTPT
jgi:glycosyltransferase involved in cell wall biosynthesis